MNERVFIVGAGGFARETLSMYVDLGRERDICAFLEENCKREGEILLGKPLYDISHLKQFSEKNKPMLIVAIGTTKRRRLVEKLRDETYRFDTLIHPSAKYSRWVKVGEGSIVAVGVIMTCQVDIGRHVILNVGVKISHDVKIGDYVTVSPGSGIMGHVTVGDEAFIGAQATIADRVRIGNGAIVAAGAVVVEDVPDMSLVAGVPAEVKKTYKSIEEKPW